MNHVKGFVPLVETSIIEKTTYSKRTMSEVELLYSKCGNVSVVRKNGINTVTVIHNNNQYVIELTQQYPFRVPSRIFVNGIAAKKICYMAGDIFKNYVKRYYGGFCFCCESLLHGEKWTPIYKLIHIINEIEMILMMKKEILLRILCNGIRAKYGCLEEFAPFEDYLLPL